MSNDFALKKQTDDCLAVTLGPISFQLERNHFSALEDKEAQQALFKRNVKRVSIETSAYCNRRCVFCPNTDGLRIKNKHLMPDEILEQVLNSLRSIQYDQQIVLHLYNEPLGDPRIFDIVRKITSALPASTVWFNTNGDYLTADIIERLASSGMDHLWVSIYGPNHGRYDEQYGANRIKDICHKCKLPAPRIAITEGHNCRAEVHVKNPDSPLFRIFFAMENHIETGYDRGGKVTIVRNSRTRRTPCATPFNEFLINHNGAAVPCCNIRSDVSPDAEVGKVSTQKDIFDIYAGRALIDWRKHLSDFSDKDGACANCTRGDIPALCTLHNAQELDKALAEII